MRRILLGFFILVVTISLSLTMGYARPEEADIPTDGLQLWLKADTAVETGATGHVTRWEDQSGKGNHALTELGGEPVLVSAGINGLPVVRFNARNTFLRVPHTENLNGGTGLSIFLVYQFSHGGRIAQKKDGTSGVEKNAWFIATATGLGVSGKYHEEHLFYPDIAYLQSNVFNGESGTVHIYNNGIVGGTLTEVDEQAPNTDDLHIGKRNRPGSSESYFGGDIAEILVYNRALTDRERKEVEEYLRGKYGFEATKKSEEVNTASLKSGMPIPVGTFDRRGPLSAGLSSYPVGVAHVFGSKQPDLFVLTGNFSVERGLFLYKWEGTGPNGEPVFGERCPVSVEGGSTNGTIFQTPDGVIHGLWLANSNLIHTYYDQKQRKFVRTTSVPLMGFPNFSRSKIAALPNDDGSYEIIVSVSDGLSWGAPGNYRDESYRPFDAAGTWMGSLSYVSLYGVRLPDLSRAPETLAQRISLTDQDVLNGFGGITVVNLGPKRERDLIGGTHFGNLVYYANEVTDGIRVGEHQLAADPSGIALRHPTVGATAVAYPNLVTGLSDLIVGGEGALYYYEFAGKFTKTGAPIFNDPTPVLVGDALLYPGSLPVPNVVDWDGDGVLDIVSGNSEGKVLFFKNLGTNEAPAFQPGVPIQAGGRDIHVQAGYSGSIQGPGEARWGYTCPTVIDWNGDGLLDIVMSDITGRHTVYLNRGTKEKALLKEGRPLYHQGLELHGTWRVKPGIAQVGERMAYVALDGEDQLHLYWRIDDYNLRDGGKLRLETGSAIGANFLAAGGTGRLKINLVDWDLDGVLDLVLGTPRHGSVPDKEFGLPQSLGLPGAAVLFLKNVGTNESPVFRFPQLVAFQGQPIYLGQHAAGPAVADFGNPAGPDLIVGDQEGRFMYYRREDLTLKDVLFARVNLSNAKLVKGIFSPSIHVVPSPDTVNLIVLKVDGKVIYEGSKVPDEIQIDSRDWTDGDHTMEVVVMDESGNWTTDSKTFHVDNTWVLRDDFEPPLKAGWMGSVDRSKTSITSSGWNYAVDFPERFFNDVHRLVRTTDKSEYLVWEVSKLKSFAVTLYAQDNKVMSNLVLSISDDGETWQDISYKIEDGKGSDSGWFRFKLTGKTPSETEVSYFRLMLTAEGEPGELQLGYVGLFGRE